MFSKSFRMALIALLVAGCATTTNEIRERQTDNVRVIETPIASDVAYRRTTDAARACLGSKGGRVEADYYPDNRTSTISLFAGAYAVGTVDINPTPGGAVATVRYLKPGPTSSGQTWIVRSVREWLAGNRTYCSFEAES